MKGFALVFSFVLIAGCGLPPPRTEVDFSLPPASVTPFKKGEKELFFLGRTGKEYEVEENFGGTKLIVSMEGIVGFKYGIFDKISGIILINSFASPEFFSPYTEKFDLLVGVEKYFYKFKGAPISLGGYLTVDEWTFFPYIGSGIYHEISPSFKEYLWIGGGVFPARMLRVTEEIKTISPSGAVSAGWEKSFFGNHFVLRVGISGVYLYAPVYKDGEIQKTNHAFLSVPAGIGFRF